MTRIIHNGIVVDTDTQKGLAGLRVEAWDASGVVPDMLGYAETDARGRFQMVQDLANVQALFEDRQALAYFRVLDVPDPPGGGPYTVVADTNGITTWDLSGEVQSESVIFADTRGVGTVKSLAPFVVRGTVYHLRQGPVDGTTDALDIVLKDVRVRAETTFGSAVQQDALGEYRITYDPTDLAVDKVLADIRVEASLSGGGLVAQSDVYGQAPPVIVVDLYTDLTTTLVGAGARYERDEASDVDAAVTNVLEGATVDTLTDDEVVAAARSSRRSEDEVRGLRAAEFLRNDATPVTLVTRDALYGLIRQGLPENRRDLLRVPASSHRAALRTAQESGQIRRMTEYELDDEVFGIVEEQVKLAIDETVDLGTANLGDVINLFVTDDRKSRSFVRRFARHEAEIDNLWSSLETPFQPTDLTDCALWARADKGALSTTGPDVPAPDGGRVNYWVDQVSGGHLTPPSSGPIFDEAVGVMDVEGIVVNPNEAVDITLSETSKDYTICVRLTQAGTGARTALSCMGGSALRVDIDDGNGKVVFHDGTTDHVLGVTAPDGDRVYTWRVDSTAATATLYIDGRQVGTIDGYDQDAQLDGLTTVGAKEVSGTRTQFLQSTLHDVIVYRRALSDDELKTLHEYAIRNPFAELTSTEAQQVRVALQWGAVTRYHLPLLNQLKTLFPTGTGSLRDIARYVESDWLALINTVGVDYPADTPGANDSEKRDNYAEIMIRTMERAQPTAAILGRLDEAAVPAEARLRTYLNDHPSFEFGLETAAHAVAAAVDAATLSQGDADDVLPRLERIQRLYKVTHRYPEIKPILDMGLESAHDIASMSADRFVEELQAYDPTFDADTARTIHARAEMRRNASTMIWAAFSAPTNGPLMAALPDWQTPTSSPDTVALAGWEEIFGKLDMCSCEHCRSVFSPAAYLVDLLQFLGKHSSEVARSGSYGKWSARDVLIGATHGAASVTGRRPDIAKLKLNCKNTNTVVPYVDLVNELLERHVAGAVPIATDIDTVATSDELLSAPEVLDSTVHKNAYSTLSTALHPWVLPFSMWQQQARVYLEHLGVPRHELMRIFQRATFKPSDVQSCAMWLRADLGVVTEGGRVTWWTDLSGNDNHMKSFSGAEGPRYGALGGSNNQAYVSFEGGEVLHAVDNSTLDMAGDVSIVLITSHIASDGWAVAKGATGVSYNYGVAQVSGALTAVYNSLESGPVWNSQSSTAVVTVSVLTGSGTTWRRNATETAGSSHAKTTNAEPLYMGAQPTGSSPTFSDYFDGRIYEAIVYAGTLTQGDINAIEAYAQERYGAAFTPAGDVEMTPTGVQIAQERLAMSKSEREHITTAIASPHDHWDLPSGTWTDDLKAVPTFLDKSGLTYEQLREFLDSGLALSFAATSETPRLEALSGTDGCNIADLTIAGLDGASIAAAWTDFMRFLRLHRRLGWEVRHLDKVIAGLGASFDDALIEALADVVGLREHRRLRRLPLDELAAWWGDLDTQATPSLEEASLYDRLFQNLAIANPAPSALALANLAGRLDDQIDHVLASIGMNGRDYRLVSSPDDARTMLNLLPALADRGLTLANLSRLFRLGSMAQALKLRVSDVMVMQALTGLAPLAGDDAPLGASPAQTRRFLDELEFVGRSGLDIPTIHYLVRHVIQPGTGVVAETAQIDERLLQLDAGLAPIVADTEYASDMTGDRLRALLEELLTTSSDGTEPDLADVANDVDDLLAILDGTSTKTDQEQRDHIDAVLGAFFDDTTSLKDTLVFNPTDTSHAVGTSCALWLEPADITRADDGRVDGWDNQVTGSVAVRQPKPTDVTTSCLLWLRGDNEVSTTTDGLVTGWADQSGSDNDAAQATQASQPRYVPGGGVAGTAGVEFDGIDDFLNVASLAATSNDRTIIVVYRQDAPATAPQYLVAGAASQLAVLAVTTTNQKLGFDPSAGEVEFSGLDAAAGDQIATLVLNSASGASAYRNTTAPPDTASYSSAGAWTAGNVVIGQSDQGDSRFKGVISEIIIYDGVLSQADLDYVHGLLASRYGLGQKRGSKYVSDGPFGLDAVQFNGANDHLLIDGLSSGPDHTFVAVLRPDALTELERRAALHADGGAIVLATQATDAASTPKPGFYASSEWKSFDDGRTGDQILTWVLDDTGTGGNGDLYRDGESAGSPQAYGTSVSLSGQAGLGGMAGETTKTFNGAIACVGLFDRALSATELAQVHQYLYKLTGHEKRYQLVLEGLLDYQRTRDATSLVGEVMAAPLGISGPVASSLVTSWLKSVVDANNPLVNDLLPATSGQAALSLDDRRRAMTRLSKAATVLRSFDVTSDDLTGICGPNRDPAWLDLNDLPLATTPWVRFDANQSTIQDGEFVLPSWLRISCPTAERSAQTSSSTAVVGLGPNAARATSRDGSTWGLLVEPTRQNFINDQDFSTWSAGGAIVTGSHADPSGGTSAHDFNDNDGGNVLSKNDVYAHAGDGLTHTLSLWLRVLYTPTTGTLITFSSGPGVSILQATEQTSWTSMVATGLVSANVALQVIPCHGAASDTGSAQLWGAQVEQGSYPTSFIGADNATFTRAADTLKADVAAVGIMADGYFDVTLTLAPLYAHDEASADHDLLYVDADNRVFFDESAATFVARINGTNVASSAVTFSRHQELTITVAHRSTGVSITVAGATMGNGTTSGSAQPALSPAPETVCVLGDDAGAQEGAELRVLQWGSSDLDTARQRYRALMNLVAALQLRDTFRAKEGSMFDLLATFTGADGVDLSEALDALATQARWSSTDVAAAATALGLEGAAELASTGVLTRLKDAVEALDRIGAPRATSWLDVDESVDDGLVTAEEVLEAVKNKHGAERWKDVGRSLRDELRDAQRKALVGYLLTTPPDASVSTVDDLYEYLLVDVEMSPCALTSRIKQAIGSVQHFVNRSLMGLEMDVRLGEVAGREYEWMKNYRVWEANRKVFYYPENWLEPQWRDDKSPLFEELESFLRQGELTDERAEEAYTRYLTGLDELSRLHVVGLVHHLEPATTDERAIDELHVIGRVRGANQNRHFHRIRVDQSYWTPWREIDLEINTEHILPVVHEGRVILVGLNFEEVEYLRLEKEVVTQYRITVWSSDFRNGQWGPMTFGTGELFEKPPGPFAGFTFKPLPPTAKFTLAYDGTAVVVIKDNSKKQGGGYWPAALGKANFDACQGALTLTVDGAGAIHGLAKPSGSEVESSGFRNVGDNYDPTLGFNTLGAQVSVWLPTSDGIKQVPVLLDGQGSIGFWLQEERRTVGSAILPFTTFIFEDGSRSYFVTSGAKASTLKITSDAVDAMQGPAPAWLPGVGETALGQSSSSPAPLEAWVGDTTVLPPEKKADSRLQFHTFLHPYVCDAVRRLRRSGVDGVRRWNEAAPLQLMADVYFDTTYDPNSEVVRTPYPVDDFDFSFGGAYSSYNWELFFHIPFLIGTRLMQEGRHDEARKWLHAIFDPTQAASSDEASRFWKVKPFADVPPLSTVQDDVATPPSQEAWLTTAIKASLSFEEEPEEEFALDKQIEVWRRLPFRPFVIARMRPLAFQRATVITYIENLIEWGDKLFRRDTIEAINEATQYYILARGLLGARPQFVEDPSPAPEVTVETVFDSTASGPTVQAESLFMQLRPSSEWANEGAPVPFFENHFCVPQNEQLLALWDTVDDRLFKIRHCMNIEGIVRELPLFEPPIDPALLVDAVAAGLDIGSVLDDLAAPRPYYRFDALLGRAIEHVQTVSSFGGALLSALEKRDGEHLSRLRQTHEITIQTMVRDTRRRQLFEARENLRSVEASRRVVEERLEYYRAIEKIIPGEADALETSEKASQQQQTANLLNLQASNLAQIPDFTVGSAGLGAAAWSVLGGGIVTNPMRLVASAHEMVAARFRDVAQQLGTLASYDRRWEEWKLQERLAERELTQIDRQIAAARIRVEIAERELRTVEEQREQAKEVEAFLKGKFTAEALYDWHVEQLSDLYYQAYKLAYELCRSVEKAYRYERGEPTARFVSFGSWDGRRKGLLAGEKLQLDLRRMQSAFLEENRREYEITKSISLAEHFPDALVMLRNGGKATIALDEALFDRDYPGHYMRRIKSVSLTLPAVTGPFTSVNCTLTLRSNKVRHDNVVGNADYAEDTEGSSADSRFTFHYGSVSSVCTSSGQNDSGMFELNFRDERYLPFEGAGVISEWQIELPHDTNWFDVRTLTDVVVQINYMAREGGAALQAAARDHALGEQTRRAKRLYHVSQDFGDAWFKFENELDGSGNQVLALDLDGKVPFIPGVGETRVEAVRLATLWDVDDVPDLPMNGTLPDGTPIGSELLVTAWPGTVYANSNGQALGTWSFTMSQDQVLGLGSDLTELWPDNPPGESYHRVKPAALQDLLVIVELARDPSA